MTHPKQFINVSLLLPLLVIDKIAVAYLNLGEAYHAVKVMFFPIARITFIVFFNRHEKVQENCIDLVGRIADRGAEHVSAREWMRICFELLELLKAHKKAIRRATVNTFGYIAKAIG